MKLISEFGNEIVITDDYMKIERLKKLGFKEKTEQPRPIRAKKGAANGNQKETK